MKPLKRLIAVLASTAILAGLALPAAAAEPDPTETTGMFSGTMGEELPPEDPTDDSDDDDIVPEDIPNNIAPANLEVPSVQGDEPGPGDGNNDGDDGDGDGDGDSQNNDIMPPLVTAFRFVDDEIVTPGTLAIEVTIEEEVSGMNYIELYFESENYDTGASESKRISPALKSGTHTIEFDLWEWPEDDMYLIQISVQDVMGNRNYYYWDDAEHAFTNNNEKLVVAKRYVTVTEGYVPQPNEAPVVTAFEFLDNEATAPGTVKARFSLETGESGVTSMDLNFEFQTSGGTRFDAYTYLLFDTPLTTGDYEYDIEIPSGWAAREHTLYMVQVSSGAGWNYYYYDYDEDQFSSRDNLTSFSVPARTITIKESERVDITPPQLLGLTIVEPSIEAPGVFTLELEIEEEDSGVSDVSISLTYLQANGMENERYFTLDFWDAPLFTGTHTLSFSISPMTPTSAYKLTEVRLFDKVGFWNNFYYHNYDGNYYSTHGDRSFAADPNVRIKNVYNFIDMGGIYDSLADDIAQLPDGTTAGVEYESGNSVVPANVFEAIVGTEIDILFYDETNNVQWLFEGATIDPSKIDGAIDLSVVPQDITWGVEEPVVQLEFPHNGELPGPATIRLMTGLTRQLHEEHGDLIATYYDDAHNATDEVIDVVQGSDLYSEFVITHNSTYVISAPAPAVVPPAPGPGPDPDPDPKPTPPPTPTPTPTPTPNPAPTPGPSLTGETGDNGTTGPGSSGSGSGRSAIASTGDSSNAFVWVALLCGALLAGGGILVYKKRGSAR